MKWIRRPEQAVSDGDASDSEGSESASDSDQNDPPSSLVADAEQYELMQIAYAAVGKDFTGSHWVGVQKATEIGDGSREMAFDTVILLATNMCGPPGSCENHARKMRTFFTRRLEPKTRSSYHIKWSNAK